MTSMSSLSSATSTYRTPPPPPAGRGERQNPMAAVAEKLGLSADDLKSQLKDGKSLEDVATAQGVSHDDLITAIKAGMPSDAVFGTGGVDATAMAEKIASTKGMPPRPPGGPRGENTGVQDSSKLSRLSELLDMGEDDVSSQASSATELVKLLQKKGVDLGALRNVLTNGDLVDVAA
ncbi:hypothetical protein AB0368_26360 [Actinoplanes sp. NPDC051475]|uniref:hypothetical protein n=1 Tax=Actinoplanes sp. NPDC051475 TaxID=3157225 RepID=UPI00344F2366